MTEAIHAFVRGKVQGVFFRAATCEQANRLAINGWVKNCVDGSVEVFAQGAAENLNVFKQWLQQGPPVASVEDVEVRLVIPQQDCQSFETRR